jgi:hypothetical protein
MTCHGECGEGRDDERLVGDGVEEFAGAVRGPRVRAHQPSSQSLTPAAAMMTTRAAVSWHSRNAAASGSRESESRFGTPMERITGATPSGDAVARRSAVPAIRRLRPRRPVSAAPLPSGSGPGGRTIQAAGWLRSHAAAALMTSRALA